MKSFYDPMRKSCRQFFGKLKLFVPVFGVDLLFVVVLAIVYSKIWEKMMVPLDAITKLMETDVAGLAGAQTDAQLNALAANSAEFIAYYKEVQYYIGVLIVSLLVMWCVFHGVNWYLTHKINHRKEKFWNFMARFTGVSIIWWVLFLLVSALGLKLSFNASMAALPVISGTALNALVIVLMFLVFYLAYTSYALIPHHNIKNLFRQTIVTSFKKWKSLLPAYILLLLILIGEYLVFLKSMSTGFVIPVLFALIIIFPTLAWSRVYTINALEN